MTAGNRVGKAASANPKSTDSSCFTIDAYSAIVSTASGVRRLPERQAASHSTKRMSDH